MMPGKPNFTEVRLKDGKLTAAGVSNTDTLDDLIGIQVFVRQEAEAGGDAKVAMGFVPQAGSPWQAEFDAQGVTAGQAMAFGVETHTSPMTTIWWAEPMEIEEK
jgi:hypothetical protein